MKNMAEPTIRDALAEILHRIHKPGAPMHQCVPCYRTAEAILASDFSARLASTLAEMCVREVQEYEAPNSTVRIYSNELGDLRADLSRALVAALRA